MENVILFSIMIANYNNCRYLQEAIDSVLEQTYTNWEVVLVDDMSTDNSCDIYAKYADDPRFRIYYNEKNGDCGYTKRWCIELAKGELCGFLYSDDDLMPQALEVMAKAHAELPECSLIYSTCYRYSGDRNAELTGRENIYMNGTILGMTKKEINGKIDEIVDFSGCERYIEYT